MGVPRFVGGDSLDLVLYMLELRKKTALMLLTWLWWKPCSILELRDNINMCIL